MILLEKIAEYYTFALLIVGIIGILAHKEEIDVPELIGRILFIGLFLLWTVVFFNRWFHL